MSQYINVSTQFDLEQRKVSRFFSASIIEYFMTRVHEMIVYILL